MADLATPSAAEVATSGAADTKTTSSKPERPDEAEYKKGLESKQKALDAANAAVVLPHPLPPYSLFKTLTF